jgi:hypothetical protein
MPPRLAVFVASIILSHNSPVVFHGTKTNEKKVIAQTLSNDLDFLLLLLVNYKWLKQ